MLLKKLNAKMFNVVAVAFLVICVLMGALCFQYYQRLQSTVTTESSGYLQEISKQIGNNVSRTINDNFSVLGTVSTVLRSAQVDSFEKIQPIVLEQQTYWNFKGLLLIDESGGAYDAYGNTVMLSTDEYLRKAIVGRERSVSASQVVDGSECIVFVIPVDKMVIGGKEIFGLAATYDLSTFDQMISMTAFGGRGYCSINQRDGSVVVRPSSKNAPTTGYNTLNTLETTAEVAAGDSIARVKTDLAAGSSGMIALTFGGEDLYMAYTPLETLDWCLLTFVPIAVVNAKSQLLLRLTLLLCGGITLAFAGLFTLLMVSTYRHKRKLEQIAYVDEITGGNTIQKFYDIAGDLLEASGRPQYALVYVNIEKFKILNEQFGRRVCDDMLKSLHRGINANLTEKECSGRLFADNFCVMVVYENERTLIERLDHWYTASEQFQQESGSIWLAPIIECGVYVIGNDSIPFPHMIDRAKLSLRETAQELYGRIRCAIYDDEVRRRLFREKRLEDLMDDAIANHEFVVFLQPKYVTSTEQIGGAEALVRWKSASEGMIFPDEFISLFEKNGFIIQMDLYVFEQVCRAIRSWIDAGRKPYKVSVNCSRRHLKNPDFIERYVEICKKYEIPPEYIEIELTENVVFEDVQHLSATIDEIHRAGFGCSMDDFGSGYSSLNMIQDIPVDTIKLDKIFFHSTSKKDFRTESVVGSILTMSKSLCMITVAEGVEERKHVDMLKRLGCDFIQGYFFARPMPIEEFETLAFGEVIQKKTPAPAAE